MKQNHIKDIDHISFQLELDVLKQINKLIDKLKKTKSHIKKRNKFEQFEYHYVNNVQHLMSDASNDYYNLKNIEFKIQNHLKKTNEQQLGHLKGFLYE